MNKQFEKFIFSGRLLLIPMYLGLIVTLLVYAIRFSVETFELVWHSFAMSETDMLIAVLQLLDIIMISHLIVMVMIGGYVLFISGSDYDDDQAAATPSELPKLKWLGHIDPWCAQSKNEHVDSRRVYHPPAGRIHQRQRRKHRILDETGRGAHGLCRLHLGYRLGQSLCLQALNLNLKSTSTIKIYRYLS
jgi:uncharacterized protein (TIGR00645 family)